MNKYNLVIFDFDGTLADTSSGILNSIRYTQKMMNLPEISERQMYSHIGPPMAESYNRNFGLEGCELNRAVSFHKEYASLEGYKELKFYDGIDTLLDRLRANGVITAVATLKAQDTVVKILKYFKRINKFDIVAGVDITVPMTKEQLLGDCLEESGINADNAVFIGDSSYDAIGAENSKIDFIGVTYGFGFHNKEDVRQYKNIGCCKNTDEISKLLWTVN